MKHTKLWIGAAVLLAIAALAWWLERPKPVGVNVVSVEVGSVAQTVANTRAGTVKACRRAGLSPQSGGQIARLNVREGDAVTAGQILLELWNEDLKAQVDVVANEVTAALERSNQACALAEVAKKELERITRLAAKDLASVDALDNARGEQIANEAACRAAGSERQVAESRWRLAQATLARTILKAPFDGRVAEINGELGEFVTPSPVGIPTPPTVDLIDDSCLYVTAPIDEVDAPGVRTGMPVRISMDAFPGHYVPAVVRRIAPYVLDIEKQARTVDVEADIKDADENLIPGYSADMEVILSEHTDVLRVPTQSVIDGDHVLVLEDGVLVAKEVETGISNWEHTEIRSGLMEDELVVVSVDRKGVAPGAYAKAL